MPRSLALSLVAVAALTCAVQAAEWGNLKGQFIYDGKPPAPEKIPLPAANVADCKAHAPNYEDLVVGEDGGLANVVIYIRPEVGEKLEIHPDYEATAKDNVILDNKDCRFQPHIVGMRTSQTLMLHNSDKFGHNTQANPFKNGDFNDLVPAGSSIARTLPQPETLPVQVGCNIHPFMRGYLLVRPDPYFAISDASGKFEIKNLPVGEWDIVVWHERPGYVKEALVGGKMTVLRKGKTFYTQPIKAGDNDMGQIKISPDLLKKKT